MSDDIWALPIFALLVLLCILAGNGCDAKAKDHEYRMEKLRIEAGYNQVVDPRTNQILWRRECPDSSNTLGVKYLRISAKN